DFDTSAHRVPIALHAHQLQVEEVVAIASTVVQQQRRIAIVGHDQVREAVIIKIRESHSASDIGFLRSDAGLFGGLYESPVALVVKERVDLLVVNFRSDLLDFRVYVPIRDEEVEPAVIVVIEKTAPKTEDFARGQRDA